VAATITAECQRVLGQQCGVITMAQARQAGMRRAQVDNLLRYGRWQRLSCGVYAAFTGAPPRAAQLWAAVLRAGPEALLGYESAAEVLGLLDRPAAAIHVTVPERLHLRPLPGLVIHRSTRVEQARHRWARPPCTSVEDTVLDLAEAAASLDGALFWLARACQRRLTNVGMLSAVLGMRPRARRRAEIGSALADIHAGAHSVLELRYLRDVERAHGLPTAHRQVSARQNGLRIYRDALYRRYRVAAELDGAAAHPDEQRRQDRRRDNAAAADGIITLRYGWADVTERACETASEVAAVLRSRGWQGTLRRCSPDCRAIP
jgi:hypothetical protein